jgi:hypothetical protein
MSFSRPSNIEEAIIPTTLSMREVCFPDLLAGGENPGAVEAGAMR